MRKLLIIAFMMSIGSVIKASNYDYLILKQTDGVVTALSSAQLKITFADGNLIASTSAGITTLPLSSLSSMQFSETATTGINNLLTDKQSARVSGRTIYVSAAKGSRIVVVNMAGMVVAEAVADGNGEMAVGGQQMSGIYVVKVGEKTTKIQVR